MFEDTKYPTIMYVLFYLTVTIRYTVTIMQYCIYLSHNKLFWFSNIVKILLEMNFFFYFNLFYNLVSVFSSHNPSQSL